MGSAVGVAAPLLRLLQRRAWVTPLGGVRYLSPSAVGRHHIQGSVLFGAGWAIAGTCPGPALAMIRAGRLLGVIVVAGAFTGIALRVAVAAHDPGLDHSAFIGAEPARAGL